MPPFKKLRPAVDRMREISAAWALCYGLFWFILPDFYISRVALLDRRRGIQAANFALLGSFAAIVISYIWSSISQTTLGQILRYAPSITSETLAMADRLAVTAQAAPIAIWVATTKPLSALLFAGSLMPPSTVKILTFYGSILLTLAARFGVVIFAFGFLGLALNQLPRLYKLTIHFALWVLIYLFL